LLGALVDGGIEWVWSAEATRKLNLRRNWTVRSDFSIPAKASAETRTHAPQQRALQHALGGNLTADSTLDRSCGCASARSATNGGSEGACTGTCCQRRNWASNSAAYRAANRANSELLGKRSKASVACVAQRVERNTCSTAEQGATADSRDQGNEWDQEPARIHQVRRIIEHIPVEVRLAAGEEDRVLGGPAAGLGVVVAGAEANQAGLGS
jgi:hypothetical protein